MMKTNCSLLVLLCREDGERHQSQWAGEDMYAVPCNFFFYEIVHKRNSNFRQQLFWKNMLYSSSSSTSNSLQKATHFLHLLLLLFLSLPNYIHSTFVHFSVTSSRCSWMIHEWVYNLHHDECENRERSEVNFVTYCWIGELLRRVGVYC
jgi:hypothetical protein